VTSRLRAALCAVVLALTCAFACGPAAAQEKSAVKEGFTLPTNGNVRIMFEPNADWTEQAKSNINLALNAAQSSLGNRILLSDEPVGPAAERLAEYRALFSTVAEAVIVYKFFPGNRLPTKKRKGVFDYTLGPGVKDVPGAADADYILFINTEDQYGSTGRKIFQLMAAMGGVGVSSGVHKGFAGLVDAHTGELVWLNADFQMGGDVRTSDGAEKRVGELLRGFPGATAETIAAR
jgi:hypothetical protein